MYYDKRIRYLSYYESGIKLQNAGYVKFQVRDSLCQMIVYVKGPRLMGSGEARIYLLSERPEKKEENNFGREDRKNDPEKHLLGTFTVRNGQGYCAVRLNAENMADSGKWYDEICGIRMELHEYQYLEAQWTVVNFMPRQRVRQDEGDAGRGQRREVNNGNATARSRRDGKSGTVAENRYGSAAVKGRQDSIIEGTDDVPVEVNLIVTPVSEKSRVQKVLKEETAQEIGEAEAPETEITFAPDRKAVKEAGETVEPTGDRDLGNAEIEVPVVELTGSIGIKEAEKEAYAGRQMVEEESMQEILEREILREEAETAQSVQPVPSVQTVQSRQSEQSMEEEILQEMEEEEALAAVEELQPSERELQPDKWEQLRRTYPVVHPIREKEEYLKIAPKDFVIFTEKYQELVHNSFLLHGYYNYKHLILGKKERDDKVIYYLGVPGTFHEREKAVAVMFGFEAFDGKREPAQNGDFGYYLRRVEI